MLDAYKITGDPDYLKACVKSYNLMRNYSTDPDPVKHRIRGPDISFLVDLTKVTGNTTYASFAKARYESARIEYGNGTAKGFAEYIRDSRHGQGLDGLIPWDINLYIQGVLALHSLYPGDNFDTDAENMAEVIYTDMTGTPGYFDPTNINEEPYILGLSGAMEAFDITGTYSDQVTILKLKLLGYQNATGEWRSTNYPTDDLDAYQHTAYVVMAMLKEGSTEAKTAAKNATVWLILKQDSNGGWLGSENSEVDSEVVQSLSDMLEEFEEFSEERLSDSENKLNDHERRISALESWRINVELALQNILIRIKAIETFLQNLGQPPETPCGNRVCEPWLNETSTNCPQDCPGNITAPNEIFITEHWRVTCPATFDNYTLSACRAESYRYGKKTTETMLSIGQTYSVNRNAGYSLKLYGLIVS